MPALPRMPSLQVAPPPRQAGICIPSIHVYVFLPKSYLSILRIILDPTLKIKVEEGLRY